MPSYVTKKRYQVGDYWLGQRSGSEAWYRMWFDARTRQTRRSSFRTTSFAEAKKRLNDWFVLNHTQSNAPTFDVTLAQVFARFYDQHAKSLVSHDVAARSMRYWLEYHGEATIKDALEPQTQMGFRQFLIGKKNLSPSSARRVLAVGKSALNWAWKRGEIEALPHIELVKAPRPEPKGRPLEMNEVARLFETATEPHLKTFMVFMLATGGRTGAIVDLRFSQIDVGNRLIHLNPNGRPQTKKHRPTVKLPEQLVEFVRMKKAIDPDAPVVTFDGREIGSVRQTWRKTKNRSGLVGNVQTYSFRHTMARWLRQQSVPAWEVAAQLGHKTLDYTTTEIYAPFDPAYLNQSSRAIDKFLATLAEKLGSQNMTNYLLRGL